MNREIKFRAWNIKLSKFASDWNWDDGEGILTPYNDDCFLMQYTGIKDENGKEIYEGDVLKWKYVNDNGYRRRESGATFSVFYNEGTAEYKTSDGDSLYTCLNDSIEVIGNIYENPELIT